jgi:hypothetical protein
MSDTEEEVFRLPEGVVELTRAEFEVRPSFKDLPVLKELLVHRLPTEHTKYGAEMDEKLFDECEKVREIYRKDFSCGKAVKIIASGRFLYEPADCMEKISAHLVEFLKAQGVEP